jgi:hypothetical protein
LKIQTKNIGTITGLLFSFFSFIATWTIVIPILSIIPAAFIEGLLADILGRNPYSKVGVATIISLFLLTIIISMMLLKFISKKTKQQEQIGGLYMFTFLLIFFFLIHPLFLYLYWATELNFRNDGQLIFSAVITFPFSSCMFLPIGLLLDKYISRQKKSS